MPICEYCREEVEPDEQAVKAEKLVPTTPSGKDPGSAKGIEVMFHAQCWAGDSARYRELARGAAQLLRPVG